jgi:hypothetical protein
MSIVFYQGRPLFRNGKIAMNANCCCDPCVFDFPCVGNCWFPVTQPKVLTLADWEANYDTDLQVGGATQIKNFYYEIRNTGLGTLAQYWSQSAISTHGVNGRKCITDRNDPFSFGTEVIVQSRNFWLVPCDLVAGGNESGEASADLVRVSFDQGWSGAVFNGTATITDDIFGVNQCSGLIEYSWQNGQLDLYVSMEVVTGLPLPSDFTCTDGFLHKNGRKFFGTKASFPSNYFPTS